MIKLVNVCKTLDNRLVLNNVSFEVKEGETFVIIGMSGTGKTVTLRHIAGLMSPDSGQVIVDGIRMDNATDKTKSELRKKMSILFQAGALLNWMTIGENVALPLTEHKLYSEAEIKKRVKENLQILQLADAEDKMPSDISGGMKKRAGLARALIQQPEILLYDEPTSGLDPVMSSMINKLIKKLQSQFNVTSIVVTHDMNSAYDIADRIAMLYNGQIVQCDVPEKIKNTDNLIVKQFIEGKLEGPISVE